MAVSHFFGSKSLPSTTNQLSAQEQTPVVTDKVVPHPAVPEMAPMSHFNLVDPVVAICRSVDAVAMYWIHLLSILIFATVVVYCQEYNLSLLDIVNEPPMGYICVIQSVVWLPQIIMNYNAKYRSLVSVAFVIPTLVYSVASTIFYQLSGYSIYAVAAASTTRFRIKEPNPDIAARNVKSPTGADKLLISEYKRLELSAASVPPAIARYHMDLLSLVTWETVDSHVLDVNEYISTMQTLTLDAAQTVTGHKQF
ncbi:hypothetical protein GGI17_003020 [Coemansia sp. S146]|nr:hypothetical protein GGI17_003020 [Coemansia sp. S146]